ncbi:integrase catalytic domain-containing protein [Trichonephila clavipes]|nr:integrase catalytic domain-containing protein [Trichonephila clavipes]
MIWINPDQRKLQRILWRENMDEPIKTFELSTVTYGTTSAPFLATRTLKQLALDEAGNFPLGSSVVMSDMYIDDVLTGAETLLEAKELKNQLINIFAKGDSSEIKVLGVYWNPKHDCFSFRVKIDLHELNTKRDVLSTIARIYDPLGLLGPVVAKAKIFLQKLWMLKIDWTDLLPDTINREWRQFVESLQVVNDININRCIVVEQPEVIELHGFSDASQSAYGAVVYCKSITSDGKMLVHLIASKSRVAPTKQTTIPRLELCAAVLLAKLVHRVKQALKLNVTNTFLWSDSMIVLSWIRKESYQLKTFVANRIATIQEMTSSEQWRYVATEDNPADFVSRGMDSLKLKTCELWWNGPKFLMSNQYPQRQIPVAVIKDPGRSITSIVEPDLTNLNENRLDNWQKITKIIQLIWKRWSVDYLNSLQQRNKWHFEKKNAKIGDMVIIKEDNLPSCQWSLGRINNIYPGKDSKRSECLRICVTSDSIECCGLMRTRPCVCLFRFQFTEDVAERGSKVSVEVGKRERPHDKACSAWPSRSPDLTTYDFYFWCFIKDWVYLPPLPAVLPNLGYMIEVAVVRIASDTMNEVWDELAYRLDVCRVTNGADMEHL